MEGIYIPGFIMNAVVLTILGLLSWWVKRQFDRKEIEEIEFKKSVADTDKTQNDKIQSLEVSLQSYVTRDALFEAIEKYHGEIKTDLDASVAEIKADTKELRKMVFELAKKQ